MKKLFFSIFMLVFAAGIFAQEVEQPTTGALVSKKGEAYLPESGDWAISFDASPLFEYLGNAFNGNSFNSAPGAKFLNNSNTIVGKLFLDDKTAIRGLVRIGYTNQTSKALVSDASFTGTITYPQIYPTVEDSYAYKNTSFGIGAGYEMRRGKTRLQGYYGADVMIWLSSTSNKYTYGNNVSNVNNAWTVSNNFGSNLVGDGYGNNARILNYKSGMTFGVGVRGFIGAEYFIFPKIAIGAEYGWGIGFQKSGKGSTEVESYDATANQVGTLKFETAGSSKFGADTDINQNSAFGFGSFGSASLRVTLHF